jgi:N-acylneuraminate cytidylyltransferase
MLAVVQHALKAIPGAPDDIIVLLQPTQPFRTPAHVTEAIRLLRETQADSVVSVVPLPLTHHPAFVCGFTADQLWGFDHSLYERPTRRQDVSPVCRMDGTVYAFRRQTVTEHGSIFGVECRPLLIDPADSCELDTMLDWEHVQQRWKQLHGEGS